MISIPVFRAISRHLTRHPWQLGLAVLGIAVGVAVIVAIRLTQLSAFDAFDTAARTTTGNATHRLVGSKGSIQHDTLRWFSDKFPAVIASPVLTRSLLLPDHPGHVIDLLGIEPLSYGALGGRATRTAPIFNLTKLMARRHGAVINAPTAEMLNLRPGSSLRIKSGAQIATVEIVEVLPPAGAAGGMVSNVIILDIASAQETLQIYDRVGHINLRIDDASTTLTIADTIESTTRDGLRLIDLAKEARDVKRLTEAFYFNLSALSLMALLVGMFLIYNTETFLVIQRRQIIGRLRALGVTRKQLLSAIIGEAVIVGAVGSICGAITGVLLANSLLSSVSTTINDLYFDTSIQNLTVAPKTLLLSVLLGILATVLAALLPALNATRVEPKSVYGRSTLTRSDIRRVVMLAAIVFATSTLFAWYTLAHSQTPHAGFFAIALVTIAFAALCPLAIISIARLLRAALGRQRYLPERLGLGTLSATLNRTGTATAALMIATAASIGIGIMVSSFRVSVSSWLDTTLRADLYIANSRFDNHARADKIEPALVARLANVPGVASTTNVLRRELQTSDGTLRLSAFSLNATAKRGFSFTDGDPATIWTRWRTDNIAIVTEPYAYHHALTIGDSLALPTDASVVDFRISGIYRDYASERGSVSISRATFDRHWSVSGYDGIGVYGDGSTSERNLADAVASVLGDNTPLVVRSTQELKQTSLEVFDRTFLITDLLRAIAIMVSFIGVFGALLAQQLERTREYGVLRAAGFSTAEMHRTVLSQTMLLGVTAATIAIPVGILIGVILIEVVNPRSFGWSMTMQIPPLLIFKSCAIALIAAFIAGVYPGFRAARIEPAEAMRYE